jgi:hypothetical protein
MATTRSVSTCHWGIPTLFLQWPLWIDASQHEWSCTRSTPPRVLTDPAFCRSCASWAPVEAQASQEPVRPQAPCHYRRALVRRADAGDGPSIA